MINKGLYRFENEHDACGVGLLVDLKGNKSHQLVEDALTVLDNMKHRGAEAADNKSGDGAGILLQIPHEFILLQGIAVPERLKYGTGLVFLPKDKTLADKYLATIEAETEKAGLKLLQTRQVPVRSEILGEAALATEPSVVQIFVTGETDAARFETELYLLRKRIESQIADERFYVVSLSNRVIVYKGMLSPWIRP